MLRKTAFALGLLVFVAAAVPLPARQVPAAGPQAPLFSEMRWRNIGPLRAGRTKAMAGVASQPFTFYGEEASVDVAQVERRWLREI